MRTVLFARLCASVVIVVLATVLTGCGASRNRDALGASVPLSAARVRIVFALEGMRPGVVFDSRTAGNAEINRIAPPTGGRAAAITRAGLLHLVAEHTTHPVTLLSYSLPQVFVWGNVTDARVWARQWQQTLAGDAAEARTHGGKPAGSHVRRFYNVGILVPESAKDESKPLKAALAELAAARRG